jgi:hypothetical protein
MSKLGIVSNNITKGGNMRAPKLPMTYETPMDMEILQAYIHKNAGYNRADARRIKRALRKLAV